MNRRRDFIHVLPTRPLRTHRMDVDLCIRDSNVRRDVQHQKINLSLLSTMSSVSSSHLAEEEVRSSAHVVPEPIESLSRKNVNFLPARLNPAVLREKRVSKRVA